MLYFQCSTVVQCITFLLHSFRVPWFPPEFGLLFEKSFACSSRCQILRWSECQKCVRKQKGGSIMAIIGAIILYSKDHPFLSQIKSGTETYCRLSNDERPVLCPVSTQSYQKAPLTQQALHSFSTQSFF